MQIWLQIQPLHTFYKNTLNFRGFKFSRDLNFANEPKIAKFAKFKSREIWKKIDIREIEVPQSLCFITLRPFSAKKLIKMQKDG